MVAAAFAAPPAALAAAARAPPSRPVIRGEPVGPGQAALGAPGAGAGVPAGAAVLAGILAVARRRAGPRRCGRAQARQQRPPGAAGLAPEDEWISRLDLPAFGKEVHELGERLKAEQGPADQAHLEQLVFWSRACAVVGLATAWMAPNPVTVLALSLWTHSAWTMMGHHVSHGGYNRTDTTGQYNSRGFAQGSVLQRCMDWFDWMLPEAWNLEHNQLHHYRLGEEADPDLVERNAEAWVGWERYTMPFLSMLLWKWSYYAPNTYKELKVAERRKSGQALPEGFDPMAPLTLNAVVNGKGKDIFSLQDFFTRVVGPYLLGHFFLLPLPFALIGGLPMYANAVCNLLLADVLSNIHGFVVIVTNHAGSDLYRFDVGCKPKSPTFYLRAITSSANFHTGGDLNDFMHGWLNYQIEHHCWPDLSMLAYRKGQPQLRAICERHGVPYVQEHVLVRLKKTLDIAMGHAKMRRYPLEWESEKDIMSWANEHPRQAAAA